MTEYYDDTSSPAPVLAETNPGGDYQQKSIVGTGVDGYSSGITGNDDQMAIIFFIIGFFTGPIGIFVNIYNYYAHRQSPNDTARTLAMLSLVWAILQGVILGIPLGLVVLCFAPFVVTMIIVCCVACCTKGNDD